MRTTRLIACGLLCAAGCTAFRGDDPPPVVVADLDAAVPDAPDVTTPLDDGSAAGDGDDGRVDAEADAGAPSKDAEAGSPFKRVFVTSKTFNGNLPGVTGADARCAAAATTAALGGTWMAWISVTGSPARDRLGHSTNPYLLLDGTLIAKSWTDLIDGTLVHAIDRNELGAQVAAGTNVWTATSSDGTAIAVLDCDAFTASTGLPLGGIGRIGSTNSVSTGWTDTLANTCDTLNALYCFEQ